MKKIKKSYRQKHRRGDARREVRRIKMRIWALNVSLAKGATYILYDDKNKVYVGDRQKVKMPAISKRCKSIVKIRNYTELILVTNKQDAYQYNTRMFDDSLCRALFHIMKTGAWRPIRIK